MTKGWLGCCLQRRALPLLLSRQTLSSCLCAAATRWECDLTHLSKSKGNNEDGFQSLQKVVIP